MKNILKQIEDGIINIKWSGWFFSGGRDHGNWHTFDMLKNNEEYGQIELNDTDGIEIKTNDKYYHIESEEKIDSVKETVFSALVRDDKEIAFLFYDKSGNLHLPEDYCDIRREDVLCPAVTDSRIKVALSTTSIELIERLSDDESPTVRKNLAMNPNTPPEIMTKLARDENIFVRGKVAESPYITEEAAEILSFEKMTYVTNKFVENKFVPPQILLDTYDRLFYEKQKQSIFDNPSTPEEIYEKLLTEESSDLVRYVIGNYEVPEKYQEIYAESDNIDLRAALATNPNAKKEILEHLAEDPEVRVRSMVALNESTPAFTLIQLQGDKNIEVRNFATHCMMQKNNAEDKRIEDYSFGQGKNEAFRKFSEKLNEVKDNGDER